MKVAVPSWEGRISPVFDTARRVLYFDVVDGEARPVGGAELPSSNPQARLRQLQEAGVALLLCGAISRPLADAVTASGLRLVPFLAGDVERVVAAFASNELGNVCFHMPGCCGRARRRRGGRCGGRWESKS